MLTNSTAMAASIPFPVHIQQVIVGVIERENLSMSAENDLEFVRYDLAGNFETFECPTAAAFKFRIFHSNMGGDIKVGECVKAPKLNEHMAEQQRKGFNSAIAVLRADTMNRDFLVNAETKFNSQIIKDRDVVFAHFNLWPAFGSLETLLMFAKESKAVILVQGRLPEAACLRPKELELCDDFRGAMREVAQKVGKALAIKEIPVTAKIEPLWPGGRTICDDIARLIMEALEQGEAKQIPVTETIRYKQHSTSPEYQADMRSASTYRAKGMDIAGAARTVGEECLRKYFKP